MMVMYFDKYYMYLCMYNFMICKNAILASIRNDDISDWTTTKLAVPGVKYLSRNKNVLWYEIQKSLQKEKTEAKLSGSKMLIGNKSSLGALQPDAQYLQSLMRNLSRQMRSTGLDSQERFDLVNYRRYMQNR